MSVGNIILSWSSINNYMSLAARRPNSWCHHHSSPGYGWCSRGKITLLYYSPHLSSRYSMFIGQRYPHSRTKDQAKAIVRHLLDLGFFRPHKILFRICSRRDVGHVRNSRGEIWHVWMCLYLRYTHNKVTLRFYLHLTGRRTHKKYTAYCL